MFMKNMTTYKVHIALVFYIASKYNVNRVVAVTDIVPSDWYDPFWSKTQFPMILGKRQFTVDGQLSVVILMTF